MITTTRILFLIAIVIILGLAAALCILHRKNVALSAKNLMISKKNDLEFPIYKQYKDSTGITHTVYVAGRAYTPDEINKGAVSKPLLDTIRKALDIKSEQALQYMKVGEEATVQKLKAFKTVDSLKRVIHRYNNDNIEISYEQADPTDTVNKDGIFGYKYKGGVNVIQYRQQKTFLGIGYYTGKTLIDVSPIDKNAVIKSLSTFSVAPSEPTFGLRASVNGFYNLKSNTPCIGAGAEVDLKKVTISGGYYLNPISKTQAPVIGIKYNFKIF